MSDTSNMVFCYGSNTLGKNGGGAAKAAQTSHGARYNQGFGPMPDGDAPTCFALPTCSKPTNEPDSAISLDTFRYYIYCFILYAKMHPELTFQVTRIGCGLAGWADTVVAPLFAEAGANCFFDSAWEPLLPGRKYWGTYGGLVPSTPTSINPARAYARAYARAAYDAYYAAHAADGQVNAGIFPIGTPGLCPSVTISAVLALDEDAKYDPDSDPSDD